MKKVSVIMSTYKTRDEYLKESINSILKQTYDNIEFIIVVDGDVKNLQFVKRFHDKRIIVIYNQKNIGLPLSLNKALKIANGDYIARMDADDISLPDRLRRQVDFLEKHRDIDAVSTFSQKFGDVKKRAITPYIKPEDIAAELSFRCLLDHPTMMFRRSFIEMNHLEYNPSYITAQDYELWSRMIRIGKIAIAPFVGVKIRIHENQVSSTKKQLQIENTHKIIEKNSLYYSLLGSDKKLLAETLLDLNASKKNTKDQNRHISRMIKISRIKYPKLAEHMLVRMCNKNLASKKLCKELFSFTYLKYLFKMAAVRTKVILPYRTPNNRISKIEHCSKLFVLKLDEWGLIRLDDKLYIKTKYDTKMGFNTLSLEYPISFNEKIQWLKLHDHNQRYTMMVDKYMVKEYVANMIGEEYIIPTIGIYDKFSDIDFKKLPKRFVMKCTHDSGGLVICTNKDELDIRAAERKINSCLRRNFYYAGREWPYKNVKPRIIIEEYIEDSIDKELRDYKLFCFNGKYRLMFIATNRQGSGETYFDFFDSDFNHLSVINGHPNAPIQPHKPVMYKQMIDLAEKLSKDIPQVRVDLYVANGRIFFGEMTFHHYSGFTRFDPEEWDKTFGKLIKLNSVKK